MIIKIHLFRGTGWISRIIRWKTWGEFAHVGIQMSNTYYEALEGSLWPFRRGRVQKYYLRSGWLKSRSRPSETLLLDVSEKDFETIQSFLEDQVDKGYDYWAILAFLTRSKESPLSKETYFCSELVADALEAGGISLFRKMDSRKIPPSLIPCSIIFENGLN